MLAASAAFQAQESSDANKPKLAAWLYFGNYALLQTAAASGSLSTNYPAAGAINGDRTEINIGPASGADNGVGLASWKSDGVPDTAPADSVWWSVTWPTAKYVNYLKLYQRAGHGLTEYWVDLYMDLGDGYQWYAVAHRVAGGSGYVGASVLPAGYGDEPYGDTPYGSPWPPYLEGEWALTLAEIDLGIDFLATAMRIRAVATEVALDYAELVAVEIYRKVDVSERVLSCDIEKKRDFKFQNTLAYTANITFENTDQFFSSGYVPTTAQRVAGFTNEDVISGTLLKVKLGYDLGNLAEYVDGYVGYLNDIKDDTPARTCVVDCRDYTQFLLNRKDYSQIKFNILIDDCAKYILNRYNISNYEMALDSSYRRLAVFFSNGEYGLDIVRELGRATTDGDFYFSEAGVATFKNYSTQNEFSINSYNKWLAYDTATNISFESPQGAIRRNYIYDSFGDSEIDSNKWNFLQNEGPYQFEMANIGAAPITEYALHLFNWSFLANGSGSSINTKKEWQAKLPFSTNDPVNIWFDLRLENFGEDLYSAYDGIFFQVGINNGVNQTVVTDYQKIPIMNKVGYYLVFQQGVTGTASEGSSQLRLVRIAVGGGRTILGYIDNWGIPSTPSRYLLQKNGTTWKLYQNGVEILSVVESGTPITGLKYLQLVDFARTDQVAAGIGSVVYGDLYFQNLMYGYTLGATGQYISQIIDSGAHYDGGDAVASNIYTVPTDATAAWKIRFSDDGITWGGYSGFTPPADLTGLGPKRYKQIKIDLGGSLFDSVQYPVISEIILTWNEDNTKYAASANISLRGQMLGSALSRTNTLAGDNIIFNKFTVYSTQPVLVGNDTDKVFNFFEQSNFISSLNPKYITADTEYEANIPGGMDDSFMAGSNPASIAFAFGLGSATAEYSRKGSVRPKIKLVVTTPILLTSLNLLGKKWDRTQKFTYVYADSASQNKYGEREFSYSSDYIQSTIHAQQIATKAVALNKEQKVFFEELPIRPMFSLQLNDRTTIYDAHEVINDDFYLVAIKHHLDKDDVHTVITPVKII